jgi:hypothetical protein
MWWRRREPDEIAGEDDSDYTLPVLPSEWRKTSDAELARVMRKVARANRWPHSAQTQHEMMYRHIVALKSFQRASAWATGVLIVLTAALVVLTGVLVWLTTQL